MQPPHFAAIGAWLDSASATRRWAGPGSVSARAGRIRARTATAAPGWVLLDAWPLPWFRQYWPTTSGTLHLGRIIRFAAGTRAWTDVLMQALMAQALQSPGAAADPACHRDNVAAVTLYRDLGFQPMEDASTPELLFMQHRAG